MNETANHAITNISTGAESVAVPTVGHTKEVKSLRCQSNLKLSISLETVSFTNCHHSNFCHLHLFTFLDFVRL